jgi:hypothetical protein
MSYVFVPFLIMLVCSVIILVSTFLSSRNVRTNRSNGLSRNNQLFLILLSTNTLFFCLVSPLVVLNAMGSIEENTVFTTLAYILAYANHA